jgi:hypothetical protein
MTFTFLSSILNSFFMEVDWPPGVERMYRAAAAVLGDNVRLLIVCGAAFAGLWSILLLYRPPSSMSPGVLVWWSALCVVSVFNICGWRLSAAALARRQAVAQFGVYIYQRRQLLLSAVFVLGCAFRSVVPRADVQRIGLFDTWVSSVMVGRSVATVAELCFAAQWALVLHRIARDSGGRFPVGISWLLVPLIVVAEVCSWCAVLTTSYLGNALEESLWALSALLVVVGFVTLWPRCRAAYRPFLAAVIAVGVGYLTFMCLVDVPMYVSRWLADEASGRQYLSLSQGLWDVGSRWVVTFAWEEWRSEIPWMSLYFSMGVWCSIALVHVPWFRTTPTLGERDTVSSIDSE